MTTDMTLLELHSGLNHVEKQNIHDQLQDILHPTEKSLELAKSRELAKSQEFTRSLDLTGSLDVTQSLFVPQINGAQADIKRG